MKSLSKVLATATALLGGVVWAPPASAYSWSHQYENTGGSVHVVDYVQVPSAGSAAIWGSLTGGYTDWGTLAINGGPSAVVYGPDFGETYVSGSIYSGNQSVRFDSEVSTWGGRVNFYVAIDW